MSDLQIGLALLGVLIVAGVLAFNWWQERQFRQRGQQAFSGRHDDVLLGQGGVTSSPAPVPASRPQREFDESRIEPRMEPQLEPEAAMREAPPAPLAPIASGVDAPRAEIDYLAELRAEQFIATEKLSRLRQDLPALSRRIRFGGLQHPSMSWEPLNESGRYTTVRVALQLVDRSGAVNEEQLRAFVDAVANLAAEIPATAELPELALALDHAVTLDEFCADFDVLVGINVVANGGQIFHGTKIRALAETAGLQLQAGGVFRCHDEQGNPLFSVDNQQAEPFMADRIRNITTPGITFLLDVPRVANGLRVFDKMVAMSRSFADSLDGTLADDNRVLLNDAGLDRIRAQLRAIYAAMEQRGIDAGSPLALRLFS
ncbi:MAG: cell division protein ZipA C-terminal FtsZ-binding domain-containing protein [Betaproteobacteria bacterium]